MDILRSGEIFRFDNDSAPDLQQAKPAPKQAMCGHMADAGGCKDGDAVAVKTKNIIAPQYKMEFII